ncbi:MAG: Gfo/Idh/MocA family oxidoreductase [Bdellovibrionales bacterium]|nr:Gfo/Idh/MocA family oxidoreductase [Bdellovibrionales bacterium]
MNKKIRYAVVGLGHIAQVAMIPAFKNARSNSELVALVSGDQKKLDVLGKRYKVPHLFHYAQFEEMLAQDLVDAVYISTPNVMHTEFAILAARYGVHVLSEKPLATTEEECVKILRAARTHKIKFMTAYRLHFEPANLEVVNIVKSKKIGDPRLFVSSFTNQIKDRTNIRLKKQMGGGPMWDIGIYCLNASRYLFQDEPIEVFAMKASGSDSRFREVEEMMTVSLRFPKKRLATFAISYGAESCAVFDIFGSKGHVNLENAYDYAEDMKMTITKNEKKKIHQFKKHDQFGPELKYFSDCILKNREPEPSAEEGLLDVRVIEAIYESAETGRPVRLDHKRKSVRPSLRQSNRRPMHREPKLVHARAES